MKSTYYLPKKTIAVSMLLFTLLLSCSSEDVDTTTTLPVDDKLAKEKSNRLTEKGVKAEHWLLDENGQIKPKTNQLNRNLDDQEAGLLEADRKEMETEFKELIQEMDDNLNNPEVRAEVAEKMRKMTSSNDYKQKMLLLAKDQLKQQNVIQK